jgi:threonine aldolase
MASDDKERRTAAQRDSDRWLSGRRPETMREKLAALDAVDALDGWPDHYGDGPVRDLEQRVANLLGTEAAVFFPTGTMSQQVALRYGADHTGNPTVALHPLGHQEVYEAHAYANLSGLRSVWPTMAARNPTAEEITALGEPVSTVVLELPLRDAGFVLPTWEELVDVTAAARAAGARVHFDGARIWESTQHLGHSLAEIVGLADSVYVSFYKTLGGLSGSVLAGTADLATYATTWRRRYGGTVFQQWPAALSALAGLDTVLPRIPDYVTHARTIATALESLPGALVHPSPPHTHQFRLWLPRPAESLNTAAITLAERDRTWFVGGWRDTETPGLSMTEVNVIEPGLVWTAEDVVEVGTRFLQIEREVAGEH